MPSSSSSGHGGRRLVDPVLLLHATSVLFSSVGVVTVSCAAVLWLRVRQLSRQQALLRLYPPILCFDGLLCCMYLLFHAVALGSGVTPGQPSAPLVDGRNPWWCRGGAAALAFAAVGQGLCQCLQADSVASLVMAQHPRRHGAASAHRHSVLLLVAVVLAAVTALLLLFLHRLGPYRDMYCLLGSEEELGWSPIVQAAFFLLVVAVTAQRYSDAYRSFRSAELQLEQRSTATVSAGQPDPAARAEQSGREGSSVLMSTGSTSDVLSSSLSSSSSPLAPSARRRSSRGSRAVLQYGLVTVATYAIAYGVSHVLSLAYFLRGKPPPFLADVTAALLVKTQPVLDSIILLWTLVRVHRKHRVVAVGWLQAPVVLPLPPPLELPPEQRRQVAGVEAENITVPLLRPALQVPDYAQRKGKKTPTTSSGFKACSFDSWGANHEGRTDGAGTEGETNSSSKSTESLSSSTNSSSRGGHRWPGYSGASSDKEAGGRLLALVPVPSPPHSSSTSPTARRDGPGSPAAFVSNVTAPSCRPAHPAQPRRHVSAPPTAVVTNVVTEAEWQEGLWEEAETMVKSNAQEEGIDAQK